MMEASLNLNPKHHLATACPASWCAIAFSRLRSRARIFLIMAGPTACSLNLRLRKLKRRRRACWRRRTHPATGTMSPRLSRRSTRGHSRGHSASGGFLSGLTVSGFCSGSLSRHIGSSTAGLGSGPCTSAVCALYVLLAALRSTLRGFQRVTGCHGRDRDQFPDGLTTCGEA